MSIINEFAAISRRFLPGAVAPLWLRPSRRMRFNWLSLPVWALAASCPGSEVNQPWTPVMLRDTTLWREGARARTVIDPRGLRIAVGEGRTWELVAQSHIQLPPDTGILKVRIGELSGGAKWFIKLRGDVRGNGRDGHVVPFHGCLQQGVVTCELDPRSLRLGHQPGLQLQLGLEGPPGAAVLFEAVEFLPATPRPAAPVIPGQQHIEAVDWMPNLPQPYHLVDWRKLAQDYDRFVFDLRAQGEFLPLIWLDDSRINSDALTFGLSSYVGDRRPETRGGGQESITCMGAVLGATLAGIDKRRQGHDYVRMCTAFFNRRNGQNLVLNLQNTRSGGSFWYEVWPHVVFYALADRYPDTPQMMDIMRTTADRWQAACEALRGAGGVPDFDHTAFDFAAMKPVDNGRWREPDAAAGVAWLEYMAWCKFRDARYREAADASLRFLDSRRENPYYEVLLPWGALAAARMNAELGTQHDVDKLVRWCFDISDCRGGWSVIVGRWGDYDCSGLVGSVDNGGGYAFAMNTFAQAGALVPLVRYDPRYARAIGKWMLNLTNAARLFYPSQHPGDRQSSGFWKGDPAGVIAYEGLRRHGQGKSPFATGDPIMHKWGPKTDLGLYGSSYVGFLGGIVRATNVPAVLQLDCLASDFFRAPAYPTFLCFNPHAAAKDIEIDVGAAPCDLYDAATHHFLRHAVAGRTVLGLPPDRAVLLVVAPAGGKKSHDGRRRLIDGIVVDYDGAAWGHGQ